jgi:SAM-dependent methyltransferase
MINIQSISRDLKCSNDGIWYASSKKEISYPVDGSDACFAIEDNSFWFQHRNNCITALIDNYPPKESGEIFDIGGGNGFVTRGIEQAGYNAVLVEPSSNGAYNAQKRGIKNIICSSLEDAHFFDNSLPAIGLFDVLEHIEDDLAFLTRINTLLKTDGIVYITVPAYSWLWSDEDSSAGHFRRYTITSLTKKLVQAGFKIEFSTYMFRFLPLPIFLLRSIPSRLGRLTTSNNVARDHIVRKSIGNNALNFVLMREIQYIKRNSPMNFGGSCLIAATPC